LRFRGGLGSCQLLTNLAASWYPPEIISYPSTTAEGTKN
jgi:hypothetical protein